MNVITEIKTQGDTMKYLLEWLRLKRPTTLNDGKDTDQLELPHAVGQSTE